MRHEAEKKLLLPTMKTNGERNAPEDEALKRSEVPVRVSEMVRVDTGPLSRAGA